ncbi:MAG TPA: biotin--[acetyl-CoA-carboxylase] ligase [Candidatus Dormibacteraeota bacterium]|nr:biotin--[acetyl-CoA-carboxylase] ligase [Candidatus Dormibacteraeota bacterium]
MGRSLSLHRRLGSTQDEARRLARAGAPPGTVVWALEQTAGRGRMDRRWVSPAGGGLWFSAVLRPEVAADRVAFLGIVAGVAVAEALRRRSGAEVRLKWPNDLRLDGRKLGGLLAEAELSGADVRHVVLGVGVNLVEPAGGFPGDLGGAAIALRPASAARDGAARTDAGAPAADLAAGHLAAILAALEAGVETWRTAGPEPARRRWLELSETIGREVRAELPAGPVVGLAVDLSPDGGLLLELPGGARRTVQSGEVIHLRQ